MVLGIATGLRESTASRAVGMPSGSIIEQVKNQLSVSRVISGLLGSNSFQQFLKLNGQSVG